LIDENPAALEAGLGRSRSFIEAAIAKGRLSAPAGADAAARITASPELASVPTADLVIEAVFENMAVKQAIFRSLDRLCGGDAVLATNTSTLDVDALAACTRRPQQVVGMHFFSPAHIMRLVEVVRARDSSPEAIATAMAVTRRMDKLGVTVGN